MTEVFLTRRFSSPLGTYLLTSSQKGLVAVTADNEMDGRIARWQRAGIQLRDGVGHNDAAAQQLEDYFAGRLRQFEIPLDLRGTQFQRDVWQELLRIPYGDTRSYLYVARSIRRPESARPVGQAVGSNPIAIIIPCHRIIGSDGSLVGYGGGLNRKRALLELESATTRQDQTRTVSR